MKLPTFFISHGAPTLLIDQSPTHFFLKQLGHHISKPDVILMISAHWETTKSHAVTTHPSPPMIYDFYGFPEELYTYQYHAMGDPIFAKELAQKLSIAGFETTEEAQRGFDHGAWVPLTLMYPAADIPVVCLSSRSDQNGAWHFNLGKALAEILADKNVLVCTSGGLTHNLRALMRDGSPPPQWATTFMKWVDQCLITRDFDPLIHYEKNAPYLKENHPYVEHFTPFLVACGVGYHADQITKLHDDIRFGSLAMTCYQFD